MARFTKVLAVCAVVVAFGVAGCSSSDTASTDASADSSDPAVASSDTAVASDSAASTDSESKSYVEGSDVTDAHAWMVDLLAAGSDVTADDLSSDADAYGMAFQDAFPEVLTDAQFVGSAVEAPTNGLSGFEAISPKAPAGLDSALGFTVKDANGDCAGGLITIGSDGLEVSKTVALPDGSPCTGQAVLDASSIQ